MEDSAIVSRIVHESCERAPSLMQTGRWWEHPPVLPPERLMFVGGAGDRLAPPKHSRLLWDHWERCRIYWFPGSHSIHLDRGKYLTEMARFVMGLGFLPQGGAQ